MHEKISLYQKSFKSRENLEILWMHKVRMKNFELNVSITLIILLIPIWKIVRKLVEQFDIWFLYRSSTFPLFKFN